MRSRFILLSEEVPTVMEEYVQYSYEDPDAGHVSVVELTPHAEFSDRISENSCTYSWYHRDTGVTYYIVPVRDNIYRVIVPRPTEK